MKVFLKSKIQTAVLFQSDLVTPQIIVMSDIPRGFCSSRSIFIYTIDLQNSFKHVKTETVAVTAIYQVYFHFHINPLKWTIY